MAHKLLLADDSITIQRVIELTFAEEDVQVVTVGDGKQAIDRIEADRPDIVLADVGMPERNGYDVVAFVKGDPRLAHIPVLLLTGAFEPIDESRACAVGCDGVLVKPFEPQMVINRVKDLLAGRKAAVSETTSVPEAALQSDREEESHEPRAGKAPGDSLEDYFDRLDAAFATLSTEPGAAGTHAVTPGSASAAAVAAERAPAEDFASWDPDLAGDAHRRTVDTPTAVDEDAGAEPEPAQPAVTSALHAETPSASLPLASAPPAAAGAAAPAAVSSASPTSQISLVEAFAALLAAENGHAMAPVGRRQAAVPDPDTVEDIVGRVLDRLREEDVKRAVLDVAERLVREEIDRIKQQTHG